MNPLRFRHGVLDWTRPYVAGVLNVTPDSFSDGGAVADAAAAVRAGLTLEAAGADIIDIGGESTRPGARPIDAATELERVIPVVRELAGRVHVPLSIDTTKAAVAAAACDAGAEIINDISGGLFDPDIVAVAAERGAAFVCGHVRGRTIAEVHAAEQAPPTFADVVNELGERLFALPMSVRARTIIDPGLGFGKGTPQNVELVRRCRELASGLYHPVMVGPSRKRFVGALSARPVHDRDDATVGAALAAVACGAHVVRVHSVERVSTALRVFGAIMSAGV